MLTASEGRFRDLEATPPNWGLGILHPSSKWCGQEVLCLPGNFMAEEPNTTIVLLLSQELGYHKPRDQSDPMK